MEEQRLYMELLSLFDAEPIAELILEPQKTTVEISLTKELDYELLKEIEHFEVSKGTIESEVEFLKEYCVRFPFHRDQIRLKTLQYYLERSA